MSTEALIIIERHKHSVYSIQKDFCGYQSRLIAKIEDVTDRRALRNTFAEHRPEIVFHAAAHKHVPMMEENPCEAVKNNIAGTRILAQASERHGVDTFVLISTDKAVNPTSVMGAAKRVAELILHARATS